MENPWDFARYNPTDGRIWIRRPPDHRMENSARRAWMDNINTATEILIEQMDRKFINLKFIFSKDDPDLRGTWVTGGPPVFPKTLEKV